MGMDFQLSRAWANSSKGFRQFQKADKALQDGNADSAVNHFGKGLDYFTNAFEHLAKAEDDADIRAGKLIDEGNAQLQKAIDKYADGNLDSAEAHYEKALDRYDQALDLVV